MVDNWSFPGLVQWFRKGDAVARKITLEVMRELGAREIMLLFSWADIHGHEKPGSWGADGLAWLDETVGLFCEAGITIHPRLFYTPHALCAKRARSAGLSPQTNFAPDDPRDFVSFLEFMLNRYGDRTSEYWQPWNEVNNDAYWSQTIDPTGELAAELLDLSIDAIHAAGKKVVLGGIIPPYPEWLAKMSRYGIVQKADVVGIHAFPGTWNKMEWRGWPYAISLVREHLRPGQEVWITETGYSTATLEDAHVQSVRMQREKEQIDYFLGICAAPAEKKLWFCVVNQAPDHPTDNVLNQGKTADHRAYHFGLVLTSGTRKALFYYWKGLHEGLTREGAYGSSIEAGRSEARGILGPAA